MPMVLKNDQLRKVHAENAVNKAIGKVCRTKTEKTVSALRRTLSSSGSSFSTLCQVPTKQAEKVYYVTVWIENKKVAMEYDIASYRSVIGVETWKKLSSPTLDKVTNKLSTYTGQDIELLGEASVKISFAGRKKVIPLSITACNHWALFGHDLMRDSKHIEVRLIKNENAIQKLVETDFVAEIMKKYALVFSKEIGTVKNFRAKVRLENEAVSKIFKPRPVPFVLKKCG